MSGCSSYAQGGFTERNLLEDALLTASRNGGSYVRRGERMPTTSSSAKPTPDDGDGDGDGDDTHTAAYITVSLGTVWPCSFVAIYFAVSIGVLSVCFPRSASKELDHQYECAFLRLDFVVTCVCGVTMLIDVFKTIGGIRWRAGYGCAANRP